MYYKINEENIPSPSEIIPLFREISSVKLHERIVANALEIAKEIKEIEAIFIGGSLALGTGDFFSDIDLGNLDFKKI